MKGRKSGTPGLRLTFQINPELPAAQYTPQKSLKPHRSPQTHGWSGLLLKRSRHSRVMHSLHYMLKRSTKELRAAVPGLSLQQRPGHSWSVLGGMCFFKCHVKVMQEIQLMEWSCFSFCIKTELQPTKSWQLFKVRINSNFSRSGERS